jgi:ABC-2 type transport system ATP-binding protein
MLALAVKNLRKTYDNNLVALRGINLEVPQGDFFALLGPNGAGKSTTIGILCSLVNKTSGEVAVFGNDLDTQLEQAKSCIGVVPQEINFNPFENILDIVTNQAGYYGIPRKVALSRAIFYLKKMGLGSKLKDSAMRLSGGMKRRLMIARALINEPKLLILDEPTAGVDIELRYELWEFLSELNQQGMTIILTTHYLEEAERLCKHIAIIDHGEIIENSDMKSLISRLNVQTLILDLATPLISPPILTEYNFKVIDELTLEIQISNHVSLNALFNDLNRQGIVVVSMRNKTNRLEELFVRLITENKNNGAS